MGKQIKAVFLFAVFFASAFLIYSEEILNPSKEKEPSQHEVYLGFGYPNSIVPVITGGIQDVLTSIFSGGNQGAKLQGFGVIKIGYNWFCFKDYGFSIGGLFTTESYKTKYTYSDAPENNYDTFSVSYTFQGNANIQYGWNLFRFYHSLSAGLCISSVFKENTPPSYLFIFNIVPLGIKIGKEQGFNFFADVGIGSTSIINAGASYRF